MWLPIGRTTRFARFRFAQLLLRIRLVVEIHAFFGEFLADSLQKLVLSCLADMNALAQSDLDDEYYRDVLSAVAKPNRTKTCLRLFHELFVLSRAGNWPLERFVYPYLTERAAGLMVSNSLCFVYFALAFTSMS